MAEAREKESFSCLKLTKNIESLLKEPKTVDLGLQTLLVLFKNALNSSNIAELAAVNDLWSKISYLEVKKQPYLLEAGKTTTIEKQLTNLFLELTVEERGKLFKFLLAQEEESTFIRAENLCQYLSEIWPGRDKFDEIIESALQEAAKLYSKNKPKNMLPVFEDFLEKVAQKIRSCSEVELLLKLVLNDLYTKYEGKEDKIDDAVLGMFSLRFINSIVRKVYEATYVNAPQDFDKDFYFKELMRAIQKLTSNKQDVNPWVTDLGNIPAHISAKCKGSLLASLKVLRGRLSAPIKQPKSNNLELREVTVELLRKIEVDTKGADSLRGIIDKTKKDFLDYKSQKTSPNTTDEKLTIASPSLGENLLKRVKKHEKDKEKRMSNVFNLFHVGNAKKLKLCKILNPIKAFILSLPILQLNSVDDSTIENSKVETHTRERSRTEVVKDGHATNFFDELQRQSARNNSAETSPSSAASAPAPK